jgi:hypothetical protein
MLNLTAAKFQFTLAVREPMFLPPYKGSTLRGGFGNVFRRIACSQKQFDDCHPCLIKNSCPYRMIFEPGPVEETELRGGFDEIPRPFVIEPPETEQIRFEPGEVLDFNLVLIGKAIDYLPYFVLVFKELGEIGIGKGRAKFELKRVAALPLSGVDGVTVFDGEKLYDQVSLIREPFPAFDSPTNDETLVISFQTMTRLKYNGIYVTAPEFPVLLRALFRRCSALQYFYCRNRLELDFRALLDRAGAVGMTRNETRWMDWERYSSRQDRRMKLGGLVGQAEYRGPWREFGEMLRWGEILHVGKGCTFGLGKYLIQFWEQPSRLRI